jgi:hypothetical protein
MEQTPSTCLRRISYWLYLISFGTNNTLPTNIYTIAIIVVRTTWVKFPLYAVGEHNGRTYRENGRPSAVILIG